MEAGEENSLKRQRTPLSDSEDNTPSTSEGNDSQKRRRLEAAGQENQSPKPSSSGHLGKFTTRPDTPIVPSVRFRVQQLTHRREEIPVAQSCPSKPEADSPPAISHENGFREPLLGEGEFSRRMERFKVPILQSSTANSVSPCTRTLSNLVTGIHQKLQNNPAAISEQASLIRREQEELSKLQFQPISENPWLKRCSSDPSLAQQGRTPPGSSSHSSWIPPAKKRVLWPPVQVNDDAEMKNGSFTEVHTSSLYTSGQRVPCDTEAPATSSSEGQLQMEWKKQNTHEDEESHKALAGNEDDHVGEPENQTVLKLSFSDDQSFSKMSFRVNQNGSEDEKSFSRLSHPEESMMKETSDDSKQTQQSSSEMASFEEVLKIDDLSHSEDEIEPSTDEELRLWRYPHCKVYNEKDSVVAEKPERVSAKEVQGEVGFSRVEMEQGVLVVSGSDSSDIQDGHLYLDNVSAEVAGFSNLQEDETPEEGDFESEHCLDDSEEQSQLSDNKGKGSYRGSHEEAATEDTEGCTQLDDVCQDSTEIQTDGVNEEYMDVESVTESRVKANEASTFSNETQTGNNTFVEDVPQLKANASHASAQAVSEAQMSEQVLEAEEMEQEATDERPDVLDGATKEADKTEGRESSKKVTFILEAELINKSSQCETNNASAATSTSDVELGSHDETNTAEIIDQMFEEVLEYAGRMEEERDDEDAEDRDSGIVAFSGDKDKMDTESEKDEEGEANEECGENDGDELLTFPPSGILSPLSKSVEAVVTPLRLAVSLESNPPSLLLTPEETTTPTTSVPLYSIDAYRTQRQSKVPTIQSVTPGIQRRAPEKSQAQQSVNTKEKITSFNEEAGKLQTVINQTLQALSCCIDEVHGQGSLEEAEAEKLLLVSCEKRSALLAEVSRLREERNSESEEPAGENKESVSQQPCRGTVSITNIQLPLKVEFVCSSHSRTGRPSHYFFILIRYGPCNIVATPLATAADAQNGDTISFPTSVTLKDIRSSFEIDVEVYSLSHTSNNNSSIDRTTTKSRVTPRKLLNTITRSSNSLTSAAAPSLNARRSSNFCLVGCHKITLASLGHSKFPLDKMKLEGKIRKLLGDEFQEKVPFLSPLEGNIYLQLNSESHSNVQHQGFLTMFELVSGYGVWHRRYFVLEGCSMYYWNHPNDKETKDAEGNISLSSSPSQYVRPVQRDSCARPFTFELVSNLPHQQQHENQEALAKCWFSTDTKEERLDWMEKLNQALLDFHTWNRTELTSQHQGES